MNKHFSYLLDQPRDVFFQKIARSRLDELVDPAGPDLSTPAPEVMSFAKIAMQVDRDLRRLEKTAGPGSDAGMTKRAMAYFEVACDNVEMDAREAATLFDKCAAAGIDRDVSSLRDELMAFVPDQMHPELFGDINKVAVDLVHEAALIKEALFSPKLIGQAIGGAAKWTGAKAVRGAEHVGAFGRSIAAKPGAIGRSLSGKAKSLTGGVKQKWYNWRAEGSRRGAQRASQDLAKVRKTGYQRGTSLGAAQQRGSATAKADLFAAREQKHLAKEQSFRQKAQAQGAEPQFQGVKEQVAAGTGYKPQYTGKAGKTGATGAADDAAQAANKPMPNQTTTTTAKPPTEGAQTAAQAAEKKGPIGVVDENNQIRPAGTGKKGTGTEGPEPAAKSTPDAPRNVEPPPPEVVANPTLKGAYDKIVAGEPITRAEKGKLIDAGVKAAIGYRVVMGQGAISGGEGLV